VKQSANKLNGIPALPWEWIVRNLAEKARVQHVPDRGGGGGEQRTRAVGGSGGMQRGAEEARGGVSGGRGCSRYGGDLMDYPTGKREAREAENKESTVLNSIRRR